jgi:Na+/phosphate symporter
VDDKTRHIREQFSDKKPSIDLLMAEDPEFLALCEDYDACVDALRYWAKSEAPEAKTRVNEYRALVRELEEEVTQFLAALEPRRLD